MIQERLLQEGKAVLSIRNPNYRYERQLEAAEPPRQVMADAEASRDARTLPWRSYLVYAAVLALWGALFWQLVWKHRCKR